MTGSTTWHEHFASIDAAPWPGPRPITDDRHLKGRDNDAEIFLAAVLDHLLVVLTADSGVGKSSLLNGRLVPKLSAEGFRPVLIDQWHFEHDEDPREFVGRVVARTLADEELPAPTAERFWERVNERYGEQLVLVLDQFEELVRFQAGLFRRTLKWIAELNREYRIRVVISLRAEYHHQLRQLERVARPFTMTTHRLEPICEEEYIREVIDGFDPRVGAITNEAREEIVTEWRAARGMDTPPGLLHLQGMLYVLHHRSMGDGPLVTIDDVDDLRNMAKAAHVSPFDFALQLAVDLKLAHCRSAAVAHGLDRILVDGADALVHRIVPNLSSGGFKLVLDEWTVATRVLATEMARSRLDDGQLRSIYADAKQACLEPTGEVQRDAWPEGSPDLGLRWCLGPRTVALGEGRSWTYQHRDWVPWEHDPRDISSGPMLGMAPPAIMFQELRRFAFAMAWLEVASLIRRSVPEPGRTMVALIHDGFGEALERGYAASEETFAHVMARLTGARGEELHWTRESISDFCSPNHQSRSAAGHLSLVNVRWRDCTVRDVEFTDLVFVNGDFRGSRFEDCAFRGVTFVNCLLDNVFFADCVIEGGTTPDLLDAFLDLDVDVLTEEGDRQLPDFTIDVSPEEVALLEYYRGLAGTEGRVVYSRTSGISAHPPLPDGPAGITWTPAVGGIAVFGGRLSSLMISNCTFLAVDVNRADEAPSRSEGTLVLRHIAGAALDLVEHRGGRVEIVDSTIRGLTVSAPERVEAADPCAPDGQGAGWTQVDVHTAVMANTWFDAGIRGIARFRNCILTQLVNCSPSDQFAVEVDFLRHYDIPVGVIADVNSLAEAYRIAVDDGASPPMDAFAAMDYRSQPARSELGGSREGEREGAESGSR
jgi:hypothetical protein